MPRKNFKRLIYTGPKKLRLKLPSKFRPSKLSQAKKNLKGVCKKTNFYRNAQKKRFKAFPPLKKKSLSTLNLERKILSKLKMTPQCKEVLLGTLLGDGSLKIAKGYKNARFAMRHAIKQRNWFEWKANRLGEIASSKAIHIQQPTKNCYGSTPMMHFQTLVSPELTKVHKIVTENNKMLIRRRWLNQLTPISLMCWWLDDGSLIANWRQGVFCCEGFSQKEQYILSQYLKKVWKVKARVVTHPIVQKKDGKVIKRSIRYRLKMGTNELKKFLRIIMPHIPCENMLYKACLRYNDSKHQQRWISELKNALPQFHKAIENFYREIPEQVFSCKNEQ